MTNFIQRHLKQLEENKGLRLYGFFLSLAHVWNFFHWFQGGFFLSMQSANNSETACFPFFPNCDLWLSQLSDSFWQFSLFAYLVTALVTGALFLRKKQFSSAWISLLCLSVMSLVLHLSNYHFSSSYLYMLHIISWVFLLFHTRAHLIPYLLVTFHMTFGAIKLNMDWLSGSTLNIPWLSGTVYSSWIYNGFLLMIPALELCLPPVLLFSKRWVHWFVLVTLIGVQIFYGSILGVYPALISISLLSLFALESFWPPSDLAPEHRLFRLANFKQPLTIYMALGFFILAQLLPYGLTKDPSLSGVYRLLSLNLLETKAECHPMLVIHRDHEVIHLDRPIRNWGARRNCDPLLFLNMGHQLCRKHQQTQDFKALSLSLVSKRLSQQKFTKILDIPNLCQRQAPLWAELFSFKEEP